MMHAFNLTTLAAMPWKNGGGLTREIVCQPPGAGLDDFDWRISLARIASDGPFSSFAGVDRVITLLDGAGVQLRSSDGSMDHRLDTPLTPFSFSGEAALQATLLDGACEDFNVMTRRARCRAQVQVLRACAAVPLAVHGLLLALRGRWQVQTAASPALALPAQQGLWWQAAPMAWQLQTQDPDAALLAVRIEPLNP